VRDPTGPEAQALQRLKQLKTAELATGQRKRQLQTLQLQKQRPTSNRGQLAPSQRADAEHALPKVQTGLFHSARRLRRAQPMSPTHEHACFQPKSSQEIILFIYNWPGVGEPIWAILLLL